MHRTVTDVPFVVGEARGQRTRGITGLAYKSVRGVTRAVGSVADLILGFLAQVVPSAGSSPQREAALAVLNGVLGDRLAATANPLAIEMSVRKAGVSVAIARADLAAAYAQPRHDVAMFVHGLCMNDLSWSRGGHDHRVALARDLGFTPVCIRYNTGLPIVANGRELSSILERSCANGRCASTAWSSSATAWADSWRAAHATTRPLVRHGWVGQLDSLVFLGTPHLGAPLERAGAWIDYLVAISPYTAPFARLGKLRSAGIKDLRHGRARDRAGDPAAERVRCYAVAASTQRPPRRTNGHLRGDGLVPVRSALGVALPATRKWVAFGTGHLELMSSPDVYARMRFMARGPARR
jgi:hypothetical protein